MKSCGIHRPCVRFKKTGMHHEKIWVDLREYPLNHFSGCVLNGWVSHFLKGGVHFLFHSDIKSKYNLELWFWEYIRVE